MPRARNIKPSFFTNDNLAECEPIARLLFIGLWTISDHKGDLEYRPKKIKAELLPYDNCDMDSLLAQLIRYGFLEKYTIGDTSYLHIVNFTKHQNPHKNEIDKGSDIPEYALESVADTQITINLDKNGTTLDKDETNPADSFFLIPESLILIPEKPASRVARPKRNSYSDEFEEFWKEYPTNGASKKESYKSFNKITGVTQNELIESIRQYTGYCQATATPIAHATTWLNQERWTIDYRELYRSEKSKGAGQHNSGLANQVERTAALAQAFIND
jgi:hypothetical protein